MKPINLDDEIEYNPEHTATKMLRDPLGFRAVLFCLDEGQTVPRHANPNEVMMHVYKGSGTIIVGDVEHAVREGEFTVARPNEMHGIRSEGEKMVVLALIVEPG
jgi:quercetin dioxygenase-like cupin family protein